ncbi:hypothetical protein [Roseobacter sp. CCS2]|uniref:hypothetical protein n=1 Tax=Roseobacter sp. CCS2 TaxID=391593 RepID=UPI0000F3F78F|nr:hypothetical protein [Roseobacter sp. CCS2]EBA10596.1 hypothetical protein RCCS2_03062 [Roseobacter sp. CCS2]
MDNKTSNDPTIRFDRMCEHLALMAQNTQRPQQVEQRGDLNLRKDGSQHRRYHAFFDDLQN